MGNRAIITLDDGKRQHPVALYVQWNGGIESVLAFVKYTYERFKRTNSDIYDFHARLCQVMGNFFSDGFSFYAYPAEEASEIGSDCDNGHFRFCVTVDGYELVNREPEDIAAVEQHEYWTNPEGTIFSAIEEKMPKQPNKDKQ